MRVIKIIIISLLLSACATKLPIIIPVKTPAASIPSKPVLPLAALNKDSTPQEVIHGYIKTVRILIVDSDDCRARLAAYNAPR